jgi:type IV pilus assembly protein PilW
MITSNERWINQKHEAFTLVELLIAMFIGLIVIVSIYSVYLTQQRSHRNQQLSMETKQNLRGAMIILEQEIRMAGYDPLESGQFGIKDIRRYHLEKSRERDPNGEPALFYSLDMDENGDPDKRNGMRNREHPNFRIRYDPKIQRQFLAWDMGGGRQPLAENIKAIGMAYAIDRDGDSMPDRWNGGSHTIWAVDADNDNHLDTHIDINNDGRIDVSDDINGDNVIDHRDGGLLDPPVPVEHIKAVRVWLLAISQYPRRGHYDNSTLVVGNRLIPPDGLGHKRQVLESVIYCRNL